MEIQLEKILQDLGLERYIVRRMEEENIRLNEEIKKLKEEKDFIQKAIKKESEGG